MKTHLLRLLKDTSERVNQVVVIFVRLKDIEARENELILFLHELVQQLHIIRVTP